MALVPIGADHSVAGIIHVQIVRDDTTGDPQAAFFAQINAPNIGPQTLPLHNSASLGFPVKSGQMTGTIHVEVDDFRTLPQGAAAAQATAIACLIVFKLQEFFSITLGSVPVTASLK